MILEIYKDGCSKDKLIAIYGGYFDFDYNAEKKSIRVTTQTETKHYPCVKLDFSVNGNFCYVCTEG